jgi:inhibitor of KinA sporulation pathway (predicted exonuclease)
MKFCVIDLETTGVPGKDGTIEELQIIEFGAVIEDTNNLLAMDDIPKYNRIIRHGQYTGGAFAINMNSRIFNILANRETYSRGEQQNAYDKDFGIISIKDLAKDFFDFLYPHFGDVSDDEFTRHLGSDYQQAPFVITPAGKNFDSFDRKFIDVIPKWGSYVKLRHRTIDPTSMYVDWYNDDTPPGLGDCLSRAGISKQVTHKAVEDCVDTLEVIRKEYNIKKPWMKK